MKVLLLDRREFEKIEGKIFHIANYSFNMKKYLTHYWSNGWCPVTQFKIDAEGNVFGRIANELVPDGIYNNIAINTNNVILESNYQRERECANL